MTHVPRSSSGSLLVSTAFLSGDNMPSEDSSPELLYMRNGGEMLVSFGEWRMKATSASIHRYWCSPLNLRGKSDGHDK